jgi:hypothetical protein
MRERKVERVCLQIPRQMHKTCPRCGGAVDRIRRRPIDRLTSLIRPVQRYQCIALECGWVGNLPRGPMPRGGERVSMTTTATH